MKLTIIYIKTDTIFTFYINGTYHIKRRGHEPTELRSWRIAHGVLQWKAYTASEWRYPFFEETSNQSITEILIDFETNYLLLGDTADRTIELQDQI